MKKVINIEAKAKCQFLFFIYKINIRYFFDHCFLRDKKSKKSKNSK